LGAICFIDGVKSPGAALNSVVVAPYIAQFGVAIREMAANSG
jgi:hypothetical protein